MTLLGSGKESGLSKSKETGKSSLLVDVISSFTLALGSFPDWTEMFPVHKFACQGDAEGIRRCLHLGMDPDEMDTDTWAPLHYACW